MNSSRAFLDPHTDEQASLWAAKLDGSTLSASERTALDQWLAADPGHRAALASYCQFSADLEQRLPSITGIREQSVEDLQALTTARSHPWLRWPSLAGAALSAAAAVALVLFINRPGEAVTVAATASAQRQSIALSDGSTVDLNARTSVRFEMTDSRRHLHLADGEAFLSVTSDTSRPFVVETPAGTVRVTGTSFNVRSDSADRLEVVVAEGRVLVHASSPTAPVALAAGDAFFADAGTSTTRRLSTEELANELAWRQGFAVFEGTPLKDAVTRFARYHGRRISVANEAGSQSVGGRHALDDLDGFLSGLEKALPVRITTNLSGAISIDSRNDR